jgi:hypothetical protein
MRSHAFTNTHNCCSISKNAFNHKHVLFLMNSFPQLMSRKCLNYSLHVQEQVIPSPRRRHPRRRQRLSRCSSRCQCRCRPVLHGGDAAPALPLVLYRGPVFGGEDHVVCAVGAETFGEEGGGGGRGGCGVVGCGGGVLVVVAGGGGVFY